MTSQGENSSDPGRWPGWVPKPVLAYLIHTHDGASIRSLARAFGCEPSTISRRIRRIENRRDDLLVDIALNRLCRRNVAPDGARHGFKDPDDMTHQADLPCLDEAKIEREAKRVLRRLNEPGACLALAPAMETAVVVRDTGEGPAVRTAVVDRVVAEAMAIKEWIEASGNGRIMRYRITASGRAALRDMVAREESGRAMRTGTAAEFLDDDDEDTAKGETARRARYTLAESPLVALARRRDRNGQPFLPEDLVAAGERLREDFELAQLGAKVAQNWQQFLTGPVDASDRRGRSGGGGGAAAARERLSAALAALGPGLGDVAVRCCCFLEGLEQAERRMGWSARSGKIVLRIALQRLKAHYDQNADHWSPLIG